MRIRIPSIVIAFCLAAPGLAWGPITSIPPAYYVSFRAVSPSIQSERPETLEGCFASEWGQKPPVDWADQPLLILRNEQAPDHLRTYLQRDDERVTLTAAGGGVYTPEGVSLEVISELAPHRVTMTRLEGQGIDRDGDGLIDALEGTYEVSSCRWSSRAPTECAREDRYRATAAGEWSAVRVPLELCSGT